MHLLLAGSAGKQGPRGVCPFRSAIVANTTGHILIWGAGKTDEARLITGIVRSLCVGNLSWRRYACSSCWLFSVFLRVQVTWDGSLTLYEAWSGPP